jgi:hypothetical protein
MHVPTENRPGRIQGISHRNMNYIDQAILSI